MNNNNALVLIMSLYNDKKDPSPLTYNYGNKTFTGRQTNEAATKLTLSEYYINKIVCITSKETITDAKKDLDNLTTYDYFMKEITDFCNVHDISVPEFVRINDFCEENNSPKINTKLLDDIFKELKDHNTYIDTTGGGRDASMLIQLLVKYMENFGRKPQKAWYSNFKDKKIYDVTSSYKVMDLIDALGTFNTTGISKDLTCLEDIMDKDLIDAVKAVNEFSEAICLNKIGNIEDKLKEMNNCFNKIIDSEEPSNLSSSEYMLKTIIPELQKGLFPQNKADIPDIINWCVRNNMQQQALTIATERIPRYLFEDIKLIKCTGNKAALLKTKQAYYDDYYHLFLSEMLKANEIFRAKAKKEKEKFIQQYLSGKLRNHKDFWNDFERITDSLPRNTNDGLAVFQHLCQHGKKASIERKQLLQTIMKRNPCTIRDIADAYADHKKVSLANLLGYPELARKPENDSLNNKFLLVDSMNSCKQENFEITDGQLERFKCIAVGYLYIKVQRNQVNHSNDKLDMNDIKNVLEKYGYSSKPNKITENIQHFTGMLRANL